MKFRTEYKVAGPELRLDPGLPVVLVGSCFAANIAAKMRECMWEAYNGAGTLYNPMSIARVLELLVFGEPHKEVESSLFENEGKIHSWLFDSHFSASSKDKVIDMIEECRRELMSALGRSRTVIVTFGTSWCYSLADSLSEVGRADEYIVSNCHKMPS